MRVKGNHISRTGKMVLLLQFLLEAAGEYYYDTENVKRWVLGPGGRSGNCETCVENSDLGWIQDDDVFLDSSGGSIDDAPAHPNCECYVEYKEKRVRVYVVI